MKKEVCLMFAFIFMASFVLADISLLEPQDVYNLGDKLYVTAEGLMGVEIGNLNVDLICGNRTTNLESMSARRYDGEEALPYSLPDGYKFLNKEDLDIENLTDILGNCQVKLTIGRQVAVTKIFTITDTILVTAVLEKESYNPGEGITVNIEAVKANGDLLYGFIEGMNSSIFSKAVENGFVTEVFSMPETIEAGTYDLGIRAYDRGKDGVLNEGFTTVSFKINQVASNMVISLSGDEVMPGEEFTIGAEIYDQSGVEMIGTVSVKVLSPKNEDIELAIPTGEFQSFNLPINATPGVWKVITSFNLLAEQREFTVLENPMVEFEFEEDGVLVVRSVGNADYNGTINVEIGNETLELELVMEIGEVRKFSLRAPQGEYEVAVSDGETSTSQQVLLTGNAVSINDLKNVSIFKAYSIVWIFLILILAAAGIVFFIRYRKTRTLGGKGKVSKTLGVVKSGVGAVKDTVSSVGSKVASKLHSKLPPKMKNHVASSINFTTKSPKVQGLDSDNYSHEDKSMVDLTKKTVGTAESTLVLKGEKHPSAVVALSVKNYSALKDHAKKALIEIINGTKDMKGLVDWRGDYVFVVFSPLATKTYNNEALATKAGFMIMKSLTEYNKKFKENINFNLGVHAGELIASKAGGKLKYTSIGNTISLAKRIADSDNGKLIVSDDIRKKLLRDLKAVKGKEIGKNQTYEVSEIKNRAADEAKLKELLKRIE